ncbi:PHD/FYVE-zinc-finger like domain-containing protein [Xylariaceae sp. FL0804]|nr:PHD/FYVE-zinc-finger like domain-containing protein [Xylariaceae sp. FL0804]
MEDTTKQAPVAPMELDMLAGENEGGDMDLHDLSALENYLSGAAAHANAFEGDSGAPDLQLDGDDALVVAADTQREEDNKAHEAHEAQEDTDVAGALPNGHDQLDGLLAFEHELDREPILHPIEVLLSPPSDPEVYERIPLSLTVESVKDEVEVGEELLYNVWFEDGRAENVAHDDLLQLKGGKSALQQYRSQTLNAFSAMMPFRRTGSTFDDADGSGSEYEDGEPPKKRFKPAVRLIPRRNTRQSSRQASTDLDVHPGGYGDDNDNERDSDDDDEVDYDLGPRRARRHTSAGIFAQGRVTRAQNTVPKYTLEDESADELTGPPRSKSDEYDGNDDFIPIISDVVKSRPKRSSKRKKKSHNYAQPDMRQDDSDSDIEFEDTRRSGRSGRNLKSMRDPEVEDDYEAFQDKPTSAPKHIATKEVFKPPPDSYFVTLHSEVCASCPDGRIEAGDGKGPLIYCQGCSYSYHRSCLGPRAQRDHRVTKIDEDDFVLQCRFCIAQPTKKDARAPDHSLCQTCKEHGTSCAEFSPKKTPKQEEKARLDNDGQDPITPVKSELINNPDNVLFRCSMCRRGYHFNHLPPLTAQRAEAEDKDDDDDVKDVRADRLEEYSMVEWKCKECLDAEHKMQTLVAWRPVDPESYLSGQVSEDYGADDIQYLVKWQGRSHFHDSWMPGSWVYGVAAPAMRISFHKREATQLPKMTTEEAVDEEWLLPDLFLNVKYRGKRATHTSKEKDLARVDDIESVFVKFQGLSYEDVVWDEPPPRSGAPWDAFCAAYDEYLTGKYFEDVSDKAMRERIKKYRSLDFEDECELKAQPAQLQRGKLMEYQLEGVNFLLFNFHQQRNVILADEMGLGKTVQIVSFISALTHGQPRCWPFLVVVPNATCPNWRRELKQWAPDLRVVTYHGGKAAQDLAYRHELFPEGPKGGIKAHVVIMSYEAASNIGTLFSTVRWVGLIVDEGQRLKNEETLLYKSLRDKQIPCRILLTGTPLQNNKRELFNLLQFIDPKQNAEDLDTKYAELTKENLPELHDLIRPYFLRRTKAQVLKFLPPMAQIILPVSMTVLQEKLSKSIMARNPELIKAIMSKHKIKLGERKSLNNIFSDLRQVLCHPFCFNSEVEDKNVDPEQMHRNLVEASPKLLLLDLMLPRLRERGHRVLIFSQFLHCLTIIEDFLTGLGLPHARIDGSLSALEKQKRIDAYNAPDSPLFAMLLSTRAGGVGINLATADTVIIYDPDFNPHQDIQALSRAHRIGQKSKVLCFQLMTKNTIEEKIMQMGRKKMALDHALIESMDSKEESGEDLESILKHGAAALFSDTSQQRITFDAASVDKLLDRSQMENTNAGDDQSAETQFSFARVWANDKGAMSADIDAGGVTDDISEQQSASIWESILKVREEAHERQRAAQQQTYGRGARRTGTQVNYNGRVGFIEGVNDVLTELLQQEQPRAAESGSEVDVEDEYIDNDDADEDEEYGSDGSGGAVAKPVVPVEQPVAQPVAAVPTKAKAKAKGIQAPPPATNAPALVLPLKGPVPATRAPEPLSRAPPTRLPPAPVLPSQRTGQSPNPNLNPNLVVSIPSRSQSSLTQRVTQNPTARPRTNAETGKAVVLPNGDVTPTGWIGGGSPCVLCRTKHASPCVNLNSELSLRMALDALRTRVNDNGTAAMRDFYLVRLRAVTRNGPQKGYG